MARVQLTFPEEVLYRTLISIRISDINYGGHVGNDAILSLLQEARLRWLKHNNMSELHFLGAALIMSDAEIVFKSELFHGEEVEIALALGEITRTGFELLYKMTDVRSQKVAVLAKTGMVFYDYGLKKIAMIPTARFKEWVEARR